MPLCHFTQFDQTGSLVCQFKDIVVHVNNKRGAVHKIRGNSWNGNYALIYKFRKWLDEIHESTREFNYFPRFSITENSI